jgi:hypothetical protein
LVVFYIPFPSYVSESPVCVYTADLCAAQLTRNELGNALAEWASAAGIHFIDPVDYFRTLAQQGEQLYYSYDAHWSPVGHTAAGKLVADYVRELLLDPDSGGYSRNWPGEG